jgi:hypothetical protein
MHPQQLCVLIPRNRLPACVDETSLLRATSIDLINYLTSKQTRPQSVGRSAAADYHAVALKVLIVVGRLFAKAFIRLSLVSSELKL